jgi:hypothetical protein
MNNNICDWCGNPITESSIHCRYGTLCSSECYEFARQHEVENAGININKPADFKEWESSDMSELFWIHLGKYMKHPNRYSLNIMQNALCWANHDNHGLSNSFRHALKWAKIDIWREKPDAENYEEASL